MNSDRKKYYEKTVDLLFLTFKELGYTDSYLRQEDISDRKNKVIVKAFGNAFSREHILFLEKFLFFEPLFIVTYDAVRSYSFNADVLPNRILNFGDVWKISYDLMPCQTSVSIVTKDGRSREIYNGVPNAETYADVKVYESAVKTGSYKNSTIKVLVYVYALTALHRCKDGDYEKTFLEVEKNIKKLIALHRDNNQAKYGDFFSFDFVSCKYDPKEVERSLDKILSVKEEVREEERAERREQFAQTMERKMEEARRECDKS